MTWDPGTGGAGEESVGQVPALGENFNEGVSVIPVVSELSIFLNSFHGASGNASITGLYSPKRN